MSLTIILAAGLISIGATSVTAPLDAVAEHGKGYAKLTGPALRQALVGQMVQSIDCYSSDLCTEVFGADGGSYRKHGDRVAWVTGSYSLLEDRVCVTLPRINTVCSFLLKSQEGRFLLVAVDEQSSDPVEVQISKAPTF